MDRTSLNCKNSKSALNLKITEALETLGDQLQIFMFHIDAFEDENIFDEFLAEQMRSICLTAANQIKSIKSRR